MVPGDTQRDTDLKQTLHVPIRCLKNIHVSTLHICPVLDGCAHGMVVGEELVCKMIFSQLNLPPHLSSKNGWLVHFASFRHLEHPGIRDDTPRLMLCMICCLSQVSTRCYVARRTSSGKSREVASAAPSKRTSISSTSRPPSGEKVRRYIYSHGAAADDERSYYTYYWIRDAR